MALTFKEYLELRSDGFSKNEISKVVAEEKPDVTLSGIQRGLRKSVATTALGVGSLAQSVGQATLAGATAAGRGIVPGGKLGSFAESLKDIKQTTGLEVFDPTTRIGAKAVEALKPVDQGEKIGKFTGDVAQFFVPGSLAAKAGTAFKLKNVGKIITNAAGDSVVAGAQARGEGASEGEALLTAFLTGLTSSTILGGTQFLKSNDWFDAKGLTKKALGLTATERGPAGASIRPTDKFIDKTKIVGNLGRVLKTAEDTTSRNERMIKDLLSDTPAPNFTEISQIKTNIIKNLTGKFGKVVKPGTITKRVDNLWGEHAFGLEDIGKTTTLKKTLSEVLGKKATPDDLIEVNSIRKSIDSIINDPGFKRLASQQGGGPLNDLKVFNAFRQEISKAVKAASGDKKHPDIGLNLSELFDDQSGWFRVRDLAFRALNKEEAKTGIGFIPAIGGVITSVGSGDIVTGVATGVGLSTLRNVAASPSIKFFVANILKGVDRTQAPQTILTKVLKKIPEEVPFNTVKAIVLELVQELTEPTKN